MARRGNPISTRIGLNRSWDSGWFSDHYYTQLSSEDLLLRSYFESMKSLRPPTLSAFGKTIFGFMLARCVILYFPKRTRIYFFIPCAPKTESYELSEKERAKDFKKAQREKLEIWGPFADEAPALPTVRLKERRGSGYHDRLIMGLRKRKVSARVSGAFHDPRVTRPLDDCKGGAPAPYARLEHKCPAVRPSFNFSVMQYLFKTKNKSHFDPSFVLNHFVGTGVASTMGLAKEGGKSTVQKLDKQEVSKKLEKRIRSRVSFLVESAAGGSLAGTELTHLISQTNISQANERGLSERTKSNLSLFPFFGATFFYLGREGSTHLSLRKAFFNHSKGGAFMLKPAVRGCLESYIGERGAPFRGPGKKLLKARLKGECCNRMGKDRLPEFLDQLIDLGARRECRKLVEMMTDRLVRESRIPYGYNAYLNEMQKIRELTSNRTKTNTIIKSVKIKSVYQSAASIAQDIAFQLRKKVRPFSAIFSQIVENLELESYVQGIRLSCSGRLEGAEIARTECYKYGKTSCNIFRHKMDYASAEVSTRYGISGVKVRIAYK